MTNYFQDNVIIPASGYEHTQGLVEIDPPSPSQLDRIEDKLDRMLSVFESLNETLERAEPFINDLGPMIEDILAHPMIRMLTKKRN